MRTILEMIKKLNSRTNPFALANSRSHYDIVNLLDHKKADIGNNAEAIYTIGTRYHSGSGVTSNLSTAVQYYQ